VVHGVQPPRLDHEQVDTERQGQGAGDDRGHGDRAHADDAEPARPANHARFNFLNPRAHDFWRNWGRAADDSVAMLRTEAGRDPYDNP
jgi:hypothetical protein